MADCHYTGRDLKSAWAKFYEDPQNRELHRQAVEAMEQGSEAVFPPPLQSGNKISNVRNKVGK
jgi:hypothetical protein